MNPNPNPIISEAYLGGRAVRHYMAVHPVTGLPAKGVSLTLRPDRSSTGGLTWRSGDDGLIDTTIAGGGPYSS